jgi:hypothetical protein
VGVRFGFLVLICRLLVKMIRVRFFHVKTPELTHMIYQQFVAECLQRYLGLEGAIDQNFELLFLFV